MPDLEPQPSPPLLDHSFSFHTVEDFDQHIRKSIPGYDALIDHIVKIGEFFIVPDTTVYDLGTSTGAFLKRLQAASELKGVHYVGVENESNFFKYHQDDQITWLHRDVTTIDNWRPTSFVTNIFTLQFVRPDRRRQVLKKLYQAMTPGAALVFCEKVYSPSGQLENINTFLHYEWKRQFFSAEEILAKEKSLRALMKLRTQDDVRHELAATGWTQVDTFWQQHGFVAWLAIK